MFRNTQFRIFPTLDLPIAVLRVYFRRRTCYLLNRRVLRQSFHFVKLNIYLKIQINYYFIEYFPR